MQCIEKNIGVYCDSRTLLCIYVSSLVKSLDCGILCHAFPLVVAGDGHDGVECI